MNKAPLRIRAVQVRAVAATMKRPLATSTGAVREAALLLIDLQTDGGIAGRSYLFGIGRHNLAPIARLVEAMAEMIKGEELAPLELERKLRARYTLLGVHNIVLFAMSGIDMAAWDALGQAQGLPLARLLGAAPRPIPAYNSNGLGILPLKQLEGEAAELVEEGFGAVKLRLGGVTGWLRAAALAQAAGVEMSSHLFPEASAHLLAATPTCHWLEFVDWAEPLLAEPFQLSNGHLVAPERPGLGMTWDEKALARYAL